MIKSAAILSFLLLSSFNIVDRLASPFVDEEVINNSTSYSEKYKDDNSKSSFLFMTIIVLLILILPSRPRYKRYYYDPELKNYKSAASVIAETLVVFFQKSFEKKYFQTKPDELKIKDEEISSLLSSNGIDPEKIKEFVKKAAEEIINFISGKPNIINDISLPPIYKKISDPVLSPFTSIKSAPELDEIYLVNFRYSIYEKALSFYMKIKFNVKNHFYYQGFFITLIDDEGFKISAIEKEGESYVTKLDSFISAQPKFSFFKSDNLKNKNTEIKIAEIFYDIYSWWKGEKTTLSKDIFSNEEIYLKLLNSRKNLSTPDTEFKISKIKVSNIEILNITEDITSMSLKIFARMVFYIDGKLIKKNLMLVNEERICDEIWEFKLTDTKIFLNDILKREGNIEPNPLQIEWNI